MSEKRCATCRHFERGAEYQEGLRFADKCALGVTAPSVDSYQTTSMTVYRMNGEVDEWFTFDRWEERGRTG